MSLYRRFIATRRLAKSCVHAGQLDLQSCFMQSPLISAKRRKLLLLQYTRVVTAPSLIKSQVVSVQDHELYGGQTHGRQSSDYQRSFEQNFKA